MVSVHVTTKVIVLVIVERNQEYHSKICSHIGDAEKVFTFCEPNKWTLWRINSHSFSKTSNSHSLFWITNCPDFRRLANQT